MEFFSFDPLRGKGQETAHVEDDLPHAYNWSLSPDGSMLAIAKARKLDLSVRPDIRLLSLMDHSERTIKLKGWPRVESGNKPKWRSDGQFLRPMERYLALWQASGDSNVWMIENF